MAKAAKKFSAEFNANTKAALESLSGLDSVVLSGASVEVLRDVWSRGVVLVGTGDLIKSLVVSEAYDQQGSPKATSEFLGAGLISEAQVRFRLTALERVIAMGFDLKAVAPFWEIVSSQKAHAIVSKLFEDEQASFLSQVAAVKLPSGKAELFKTLVAQAAELVAARKSAKDDAAETAGDSKSVPVGFESTDDALAMISQAVQMLADVELSAEQRALMGRLAADLSALSN